MYKQSNPLTVSSALFALIVTALVLLAASSVNAQSDEISTSTNGRNAEARAAKEIRRAEFASSTAERKAEFAERRAALASSTAERRAELAEKRAELASSTAERRAALSEQKQARIMQIGDKITNSLTRGMDKLQGFSDALRERTESLEGNGVDTGDTEDLLNQVDVLLDAAGTAIDGIDVNVEYAATSDEPETDWEDARAQYEEVRNTLRSARDLLHEALDTLKKAVSDAGYGSGVSAATRNDNSSDEESQEEAEEDSTDE